MEKIKTIQEQVKEIKKELALRFSPRQSGATNDFIGIIEEYLTTAEQRGVDKERERCIREIEQYKINAQDLPDEEIRINELLSEIQEDLQAINLTE